LNEKYAQRGKGAEAQRHKEKDKKQGKNVVDPGSLKASVFAEASTRHGAATSFWWFFFVFLRFLSKIATISSILTFKNSHFSLVSSKSIV